MDRILIIEDNKHLGPSLKKGLSEQGYDTALAPNGKTALALLPENRPDLILLDLGLPDCSGIELMQVFRKRGFSNPVLILTARDRLTDRVQGLDAGADDYLVKPFALAELLARVRALLRRAPAVSRTLHAGDLVIDLVTRHVVRGGKPLNLTPREFDILAYLAQHAGEVVSKEMLAENVWREPSRVTPLDNVIDVHVSRLRRKLTDERDACPLHVARGRGIVLEGTT